MAAINPPVAITVRQPSLVAGLKKPTVGAPRVELGPIRWNQRLNAIFGAQKGTDGASASPR